MKFLAVASLTTAALALSGHVHTGPLAARAPHRHITRRNPSFTHHKRRLALHKRKPIGEGDSATQPLNLAEGSFTAAQGCAVWHTVAAGEVCLGLIDKSSVGFTLDTFIQYNPSVGADCSSLQEGTAYCVDNEGPSNDTQAAAPSPAVAQQEVVPSSAAQAAPSPRVALAQSSDDADEEDCEDEEETTSGDDEEEEDCEDDETSGDDGLDAPVSNGNDNQQVKIQAKPKSFSPPTSTSAPAPEPTSDGSDDDNNDQGGDDENGANGGEAKGEYTGGQATYFSQRGNAGNCGKVNPDSAMIVALPTALYANGAHCGKQVRITNLKIGKTMTATVADSCPGCVTNGLDLSTGLFSALGNGDMDQGVFPIKWDFI